MNLIVELVQQLEASYLMENSFCLMLSVLQYMVHLIQVVAHNFLGEYLKRYIIQADSGQIERSTTITSFDVKFYYCHPHSNFVFI